MESFDTASFSCVLQAPLFMGVYGGIFDENLHDAFGLDFWVNCSMVQPAVGIWI